MRIYINVVVGICLFFININRFYMLYFIIRKTQNIEKKKKKNVSLKRVFYQIDRNIFPKNRNEQCLLRSTVGYFVLYFYGFNPKFNIGIKDQPFRAHAWIEVNGNPVCEYRENTKSYEKIL